MRRLLLIAGVAALTIPALTIPGVAAAQPGCLPQAPNGQAVTAPCSGYYDADGVWRQGGGHYDADGAWHSDSGYYTADGEWVAATPTTNVTTPAGPEAAGDYGVETSFSGAPDLAGRERLLEGRIEAGRTAGMISRVDATLDLGKLAGIRQIEASFAARHNGLTDEDRADLNARLGDLDAAVSAQRRAPD